ncbi:apolipoprotein N-acyltransferase [Alteromonas halophila]|uniref:Apolipoprotein N-acyltransferase n=1 Tax=Alteromonas halophila TaxID=516698 RepID=A0A918JG18_9ALTE|nr:apolipoprotein N-acyltransferase [Alteromonas halophila]GGW75836.1 apolipoprotein N-acyltransferase [Alteromonas halophila]
MLAGASLTFAFAPFGVWPVTILACAIAVRQLHRTEHRGFLTGWVFGLGWFGAGISWVHVSIADYGGLPLIGSVGMMALLCAYLSLYPALAFYLTRRLFPAHLMPLALPFFWTLSEWLRSWVFSGFPWLSLGYSQIDSPLAGWFPILGETGISALLVCLGAALALAHTRAALLRAGLAIAIAYVSGWVASTYSWVTPERSISMAMVQGNIAQSLRWVPEQDGPTMEKYRTLTEPLWDNDVIIWPEAAVPKLEPLALDYLAEIDKKAAQTNSALVTGIVNFNWENDDAWNSMIVLGKKQPDAQQGHYRYFHSNRYAKHHLLPIGEVVPFEDLLRGLAPIFDLPMSSFARGDFQQPNIQANGVSMAPALCFEIAFPRQVGANVHNDTDAIITLSNDAWFGNSHGPAQHMEIARVRALEFGRPVIRSTNNGISGFIDHRGNVTSRLPQFEVGSLSSPVTLTRGITPYGRFGDILIWGLTLAMLVLAWRLRRQ